MSKIWVFRAFSRLKNSRCRILNFLTTDRKSEHWNQDTGVPTLFTNNTAFHDKIHTFRDHDILKWIPGTATISADLPGVSTPMSSLCRSSAAMPVAARSALTGGTHWSPSHQTPVPLLSGTRRSPGPSRRLSSLSPTFKKVIQCRMVFFSHQSTPELSVLCSGLTQDRITYP